MTLINIATQPSFLGNLSILKVVVLIRILLTQNFAHM